MGKCLARKFNGTISSDLPYYNGIRVNLTKNGLMLRLNKGSSSSCKIVARSGSFNVLNSSKELIESAITAYTVSSGNIYINASTSTANIAVISDSKVFGRFQQDGSATDGALYLDDMAYMKADNMSLQNFISSGILDLNTIDTASLSWITLTVTDDGHSKLYIPDNKYFGGSSMTNARFGIVGLTPNSHYADFDIIAFKNCTSLTTLYAQHSLDVRGSIESLCDALSENGRTSGTLDIMVGGTSCTYNGVVQTEDVAEAFGKTITVTFTADGWSATQS